ncbi:Acyl-CoA synthetases (AMP-forming)/AMP-acid ligases II [Nocardioides sp. J9]|uniref:AMP-binding protein n=1 Tax=Nocardioides sp. J9 TaxID=935844 RepID=UPI0011A912C4|nr:AMP-binding protein [Nocardioides sp. J9]TWG94920.1 Acyl-CoA synthetases (AMP-forming)/AMP-acid ligases II [Nocardioides sp. J9]
MTISEADVAAMRGHALLGADGDPVLDHVTLTGRSILLASVLAGHGLRRGDLVALLADQSVLVHEFLVGIRRAGLVLMVVDPTHSLEQNAFAINTAGAWVLVAGTAHGERARALVPLTPYITARYGLDGELPEHRALPVARSAAPVRLTEAGPAGTLHHVIGMSGRPLVLALPDAVTDDQGGAHVRELLGDLVPDNSTVLASSSPALSPVAALLGTAVLAAGGAVTVPRRPTGVELLRTAFGVDATVLYLTAAVAAEVADLPQDRARRLTPAGLDVAVVEGDGLDADARASLERLWGGAARIVEPAYLDPATLELAVIGAGIAPAVAEASSS